MAPRLDEDAVAAIRRALAGASHGARALVVADLARCYGVSAATVYRAAQLGGSARGRRAQRPEYRGWVETAVALAHRAPTGAPLDIAIASGIAAGELPPEAASMPLSTAYRVARALGLRPPPRRTRRMNADYPMQALQFDASTSAHLIPVEPLGEGDWLLRLHRSPLPASGYKNKPLAAHRQRLLVYGVWDMRTGYSRAHYLVAQGESGADSARALVQLLSPTGDPQRPLHGLPDDLWVDQGPAVKHAPTRDLLSRLGVALVFGAPYQKTRQGGVERPWRTLWQRFEASLFLTGVETLKLSALQGRLAEYERRENGRPARLAVGGRRVSRAQAWVAGVNGRPADNPLRALPPDALATLHRQARRRIDRNGIVRWDGVEYECLEWHSRWVVARQALDGPADCLTLVCPVSGERSLARKLVARPYQAPGPVARVTALDALLARQGETLVGGDPYAAGSAPTTAPNVAPMRTRAASADALENPLDARAYGSLEAALQAFARLYPWPLGAADREAVAASIEAGGRDRQAVADLAARLINQLNQTTGGTR